MFFPVPHSPILQKIMKLSAPPIIVDGPSQIREIRSVLGYIPDSDELGIFITGQKDQKAFHVRKHRCSF